MCPKRNRIESELCQLMTASAAQMAAPWQPGSANADEPDAIDQRLEGVESMLVAETNIAVKTS